MFENIMGFFKKISKKEKQKDSSNTAKERLHLVLMQDRANVSADFLELMREEIIEVIKKYIDIDEKSIDVKLTNKMNEDGTVGAPALYANIPIITIKNEARKQEVENAPEEQNKQEEQQEQQENETNQENNVEQKTQQVDSEEQQENKEEIKQEKEGQNEEKKEQNKEQTKVSS